MNKYIVRTSLVWIGIMVVVAGSFVYHSRSSQHPNSKHSPTSSDTQPVAAGPASNAEDTSAVQE